MRIVFYPYKLGSRGCKDLALKLSALRVRPSGRYRPRRGDVIINWGSSRQPSWNDELLINSTFAVALACNKLNALKVIKDKGILTPDFTQNPNVAKEWDRVVARYILNGYGGRGIKIMSGFEVLNNPVPRLYTKYLSGDNKREYRVHVFNGKIIDYSKKIFEGEISSHCLGSYFVRHGIERITSVQDTAIKTVNALGLIFGAVDIIRVNNTNYVLEVNTAPGLSPEGLTKYSEAILNLVS